MRSMPLTQTTIYSTKKLLWSLQNEIFFNKKAKIIKNILIDIIPAIPPLLEIAEWWKACGLEKSSSKSIPLLNLKEYLLTNKNIKKVK